MKSWVSDIKYVCEGVHESLADAVGPPSDEFCIIAT